MFQQFRSILFGDYLIKLIEHRSQRTHTHTETHTTTRINTERCFVATASVAAAVDAALKFDIYSDPCLVAEWSISFHCCRCQINRELKLKSIPFVRTYTHTHTHQNTYATHLPVTKRYRGNLYLKFSFGCLLFEMWNLSKNDESQRNRVRDYIIYLVQHHFPSSYWKWQRPHILFASLFSGSSMFLSPSTHFTTHRLMKNFDTTAQIGLYIYCPFDKKNQQQQEQQPEQQPEKEKIVELELFPSFRFWRIPNDFCRIFNTFPNTNR